MTNKYSLFFILYSLIALLLAIFWGGLISFQYIFPDFLKDILPFNKMRPLHVVSTVSWIILASTGGIYYYISKEIKLHFNKLTSIHFIIFLLTGVAIYLSFLTYKMGGREYLVFPPVLIIPILLGWLIFGTNIFYNLIKKCKNWPVYYWMFCTGIFFMIYHLCESYFWTIPYFRQDFIRDFAVQWKSYGSFIGSWNMLVYGTAIYLMSKINGTEEIAKSKKVFFFYFLGLANLMFGWAHHIYIVPTKPWIRIVAYVISMTEWIVLINIISEWSKSLSKEKKIANKLVRKFLLAADFWVILNLFLALLISIPAINLFTHGTHITVAHSMGTTIGINTMILLSSVLYIISTLNKEALLKRENIIVKGFYLLQISFTIFWLCLIFAGSDKSY